MTETCSQHRDEMRLLALRRKLADERLPVDEKQRLELEIAEMEAELDLG